MGKVNNLFCQKRRGIRITMLLCRDGDLCWICGLKLDRRNRNEFSPGYITFDHVIPRALGGIDSIENIRLAHKKCNNERGNDPVLPEEEAGI